MHHPNTQKHADAREPTDQDGRYGRAKVGHGDRGRQPLQLGCSDNCGADPEHASDDRSGEAPGLTCCVAKDGTDDGTEARQGWRGKALPDRYSAFSNQ